jgi:Bap31/Bap29 transmembrane region
MVVFVGLIIPLPYKIKRKLFTFISESPLVAKVQYGMKVRGQCGTLVDRLWADDGFHADHLHFHSYSLPRQRQSGLQSPG